jgi:serine protease Do
MPRTIAAMRAGLLVVGLIGAGTEARAQHQRKTPIVEAVQKTRPGIVTLKVHRPDGRKDVIGTGIVVDERGYIVTNRHVVAAADGILVRLADGTELAGKTAVEIGTHDLAVVRVRTEKKLHALPLGPAGDIMVGETVIAIGNPFGYANSVSTGIVSALGREVTMPAGETIGNLIQTDASINPGNSGGPLLNINGELIGIVVALRDGAQGIAFAIDADTVQALLSEHLSAAKISGVHHGLVCKEKTSAEGERRRRVLVESAATGLKPGDEILSVADRKVRSRFDLERAFWSCKPDDAVAVTLRRDGRERTVTITLTRNDDREPAAAVPRPKKPVSGQAQTAGR